MAMNMDAMLRIKADVQGENNIRKLGNSLQGLQGQAKNAALAFNGLKGAVGGFAAAIVGSAIVGGLGAMVKSAINLGDELGKMSARTGVAQDALIGLRNAAALSDVANEKLQAGLTKLNVAMVAAADGNAAAEAKFKRLGVSVKDAAGQVRPTAEVFKDLADRFKDMPNGAEKAAAAVSVFGKAGAELIPLLNGGREAMEAFNYELSDEFSARSELFNDTITILGFKTEGFKLQLADALLPALQSILEVFGDLFDTKNDWTALFEVIKFGLRAVATVLYATIKLVDVFVKTIVFSFDAIGKALQGDFAAAGQALSQGFGANLEQAKRDFEQIRKLWTDAPAPTSSLGSSRLGAFEDPAAAARAGRADQSARDKAAADAKRAATEQERLMERRASLTQKGIDLQQQLRRSIEDTRDAFDVLGASPTQQLQLARDTALLESKRNLDDLTKSVVALGNEVTQAGGKFDFKPFLDLLNQLGRADAELAEGDYNQGLKDLLPSLDEYDAKIAEVVRGKTELTELEKLNAQVNLLQLDILAQTNPALAEQIRLLRERAGALDEATAKQKANSESFGTQFKEAFKQAYDSATNLGANLASIATNGIGGLTDAIVNFAATGKAAFKEFAASVLKELGAMLIKFAIFKAISGIAGAFGGGGNFGSPFVVAATGGATGPSSAAPLKKFATGGVMSGNNVVPLKRYAAGGITSQPQLALYGERGPEAYVPLPDGRSIPVKMKGSNSAEAMERYRPVPTGRGGSSGSAESMGEGGPAMAGSNTIDVRYSVERINNVEYVTADQFRSGMQNAAREGANRGEQQALRRLQNAPSARKRIGI